jgi:predicted transcriptional regulator
MVSEVLETLPDDATPDDFLNRFFIRTQIEHALEQEKNGDVVEHEEIERKIAQWLGE